MRSLTTPATVAALVLASGPALGPLLPAPAAAAAPSVRPCGHHGDARFPLDARLHGGPARYARGGGWHGWYVALRNTTGAACRAVHPVVVLVDDARELRPRDIRFGFRDPAEGGRGRWRKVSFTRTDEAENVGAFTGFRGVVVPAGRTVEVPVRTRFTAGAPTGPVTVDVTTVQRRADDGEWIGQSRGYRFTVTRPPRPAVAPGGTASGTGAGPAAGAREAGGAGGGEEGGNGAAAPPRLAATGRDQALLGLGLTSTVLLLSGAVLVVRSRGQRRGPGR